VGTLKKILLLEDDPILGETLVELLEINNFNVLWSKDGQNAADILFEKKFDLLLLDINVPYLNGFELLESLRSIDDNTPAIFITANADIESLKRGFDVGADDYLKKPFDFEELLIRIDALLKKNIIQTIVYKDLVFDTTTKKLTKNSTPIHLTPSEMNLFELFVTNQEKVFQTHELLEAANSQEFNAQTLRVWISKLKKIGLELTNIRGVGYRCEAV